MMRKRLLAFLLTLAMTLSVVTPALAADDTGSSALVTYSDLAAYGLETQDGETETLGTVLRTLFTFAGLKDSQLGSDSDCVALADSLGMLDKNSASADEPCTKAQMAAFLKNAGYQALVDNQSAEKKEPLFVNGMAQPVFPYTTGSVTSGYSNETSDIARYCVYVETNYDTDGDGKLDLVKALVQVPKAAAEGDYKAATIYEARPYITGCTDRSMGYDTEANFDINSLYDTNPDPRTPAGTATTLEAAAKAQSSDWYYYNPFEDMMDYEDLEWYDYYLVRGYAVVECGGLGTRGSEGYETCGSDLEIDAFKCVIEWLSGERAAYTDKTSNIRIYADWSNGNVGMTGRSYAGTTQFGLATTGVKGLKTIVPVAGIASWYEYTNSQGISTRSSTAYTNTLAAYCAGRYLDSDAAQAAAKKANVTDYVHSNDYASISERYSDYLGALANQQTALNGDYASQDAAVNNDTWSIRDYTVDTTRTGPIGTTGPSRINCSALIVHGLNDYNVRTKEFELMYNAFEKAGKTAKILLHQDGHLTPTYPAGGYVFDIGDSSYDEILNRWFSHYLYGVDNGAENMAAVTAQDSHNTNTWNTYASWTTDDKLTFDPAETGTTTINSDYNANSVTRNNWQDKFTAGTTTNSVMYTQAVTESTTVKGSVAVNFSALTENLGEGGTPIGGRDGLMVSAMLVDIAPEGKTFPAFNTSGSYVPKATALQNGAWMGGGLKNFNKTLLLPSDVSYKVISRGWMDLCNPEAGFASHTASKKVTLGSQSYDYTLYLQPTVYEVKAGHTLALVIYAHEPGMTSYYSYDKDWNLVVNPNFQNYQITVDNASVSASIPVATDAGASETCPGSTFTVSASAQGSGSVKSSASSATVMEGASVTFTAQPESGYRLDHWVVNGENAGSAATLTLTVDANTTVIAVFTQIPSSGGSTGGSTTEPADETPFTDVSADSPYADAILWAAKNGVTQGKTATTFGPSDSCTRGQIVTVLWRAAGSPAAKGNVAVPADVAPGSYCYDAVAWALENGITKGTTDTTFSPDAPCTRGQAVTFLCRAVGTEGTGDTGFADVGANSFCAGSVKWAVENGVTKGITATTFSPNETCTRGQIVTFLYRAMGK